MSDSRPPLYAVGSTDRHRVFGTMIGSTSADFAADRERRGGVAGVVRGQAGRVARAAAGGADLLAHFQLRTPLRHA